MIIMSSRVRLEKRANAKDANMQFSFQSAQENDNFNEHLCYDERKLVRVVDCFSMLYRCWDCVFFLFFVERLRIITKEMQYGVLRKQMVEAAWLMGY